MTNILPSSLSDHELLAETLRAAGAERQATVVLLVLLAEVDRRRLYLGAGFSSLFSYCTQRLTLSEPAAYSRITAARAARRFPLMWSMLEAGDVTLTTIGLLAAHLTEDNYASLLVAARGRSKREVERMVAALHSQPDIPASVRALPVSRAEQRAESLSVPLEASDNSFERASEPVPLALSSAPEPSRRPATVAPLACRRYLIKVTVSEETQQKLQRARDLLRHLIPDGDLAAILDRALTLLLQDAERTKFGAVARPRGQSAQRQPTSRQASRRVPASVRRAVWARDEGRCRFVGSHGRCVETGGLEFHHVVPFAAGGKMTIENIELRCRAHNAYESTLVFGEWRGRDDLTKAAEKLSLPAGSG